MDEIHYSIFGSFFLARYSIHLPPAVCKLKCCFIPRSLGESKEKEWPFIPLEKENDEASGFLAPSTSYGTVAGIPEESAEASCQALNSVAMHLDATAGPD